MQFINLSKILFKDEEAEDFDDETMMKLDDKIAAAFRHMTKNKKEAKEKELQLVHFKNKYCFMLFLFNMHQIFGFVHVNCAFTLPDSDSDSVQFRRYYF